jgi:hypothetical protein
MNQFMWTFCVLMIAGLIGLWGWMFWMLKRESATIKRRYFAARRLALRNKARLHGRHGGQLAGVGGVLWHYVGRDPCSHSDRFEMQANARKS